MVYGMYPEICMDPECAKENLMEHCSAMLFKDIYSLGGIRLGDKFEKLVQYLAYNVGSLISYDSVSREIGLNKNTVADYITLLEQCFIVKVCPSYAKNLSNELKKKQEDLLLRQWHSQCCNWGFLAHLESLRCWCLMGKFCIHRAPETAYSE